MFHLPAFDRNVHQDICVVNVDPEKLMNKLKDRYGTNFEVHVRYLPPPVAILDVADL